MRYVRHIITIAVLLFGVSQVSAQQDMQRGAEYLEEGQYEAAIDHFQQMLEEGGMYEDQVYFFLARAYGMAGNYQQGLQKAENALEKYPDHAAIQFVKAELTGYTDPFAGAEKMHHIYREYADDPELQARNISPDELKGFAGQLYSVAGSEFHGQDRMDKSVEALKQARDLIPDSLYVHNNLIYTLMLKENYDGAIDAADHALERFPDERNIELMRSQALSLAGRGEDHLEDIERLYRPDPDDATAAIAYGQALMKEGKAMDAAEHFEEFLERNPQERQVYQVLIQMNKQQFEYEGVAEVLIMKAEAFPNEPEIQLELAETLAMIEDFEDAREQYLKLEEQTGEPRFRLENVRLYLVEERWEKAKQEYKSLIDDDPETQTAEEAYADLIRLHSYRENTTDALDAAEQAYRNYQESPEIQKLYLWQLYRQGKTDEAREIAEGMVERELKHSGLPYMIKAENEQSTGRKLELAREAMQIELDQADRVGEQIQAGAQAALGGDVQLQIPVLDERSRLEEHQQFLDEMAGVVSGVKDVEQRAGFYRDLGEENESNVWIKQQKAEALLDLDETDEAEQVLISAARINPDDTDLHQKIADIFEESGNYEQAILAWERALGADEEFEEAYENLIRLHRKTGTLDKLCDRWQAQYRADSQNEYLAEYLIDALHRAGRVEEARKIVEEMD